MRRADPSRGEPHGSPAGGRPRRGMRRRASLVLLALAVFFAAAIGLAAALALVLTITAIGAPPGETSPEPLLTTVPGPKK